MKAIFRRKLSNFEELKEETERAIENGDSGNIYKITREIKLSNENYIKLISNFFVDQTWIKKNEGGSTPIGEFKCIRVINKDTNEKLLINPEGYSYPRYTALEN